MSLKGLGKTDKRKEATPDALKALTKGAAVSIKNKTTATETQTTAPTKIKPLQLKVSELKHTEFKSYAASKGKTMVALFDEMFAEYKQNHG